MVVVMSYYHQVWSPQFNAGYVARTERLHPEDLPAVREAQEVNRSRYLTTYRKTYPPPELRPPAPALPPAQLYPKRRRRPQQPLPYHKPPEPRQLIGGRFVTPRKLRADKPPQETERILRGLERLKAQGANP